MLSREVLICYNRDCSTIQVRPQDQGADINADGKDQAQEVSAWTKNSTGSWRP